MIYSATLPKKKKN